MYALTVTLVCVSVLSSCDSRPKSSGGGGGGGGGKKVIEITPITVDPKSNKALAYILAQADVAQELSKLFHPVSSEELFPRDDSFWDLDYLSRGRRARGHHRPRGHSAGRPYTVDVQPILGPHLDSDILNVADIIGKGLLNPGGDILLPGGDILLPGGDILLPGGDTLNPSGDILHPGDDILLPGGDILLPGGDIILPGGNILLPGGDILNPVGDILIPDGDILIPDGDILIPDGDILNPDGNVLLPGGDILRRDGDILHPDGDILIPGDGILNPDGDILNRDGSILLQGGDILHPDGDILLLGDDILDPDNLQQVTAGNMLYYETILTPNYIPEASDTESDSESPDSGFVDSESSDSESTSSEELVVVPPPSPSAPLVDDDDELRDLLIQSLFEIVGPVSGLPPVDGDLVTPTEVLSTELKVAESEAVDLDLDTGDQLDGAVLPDTRRVFDGNTQVSFDYNDIVIEASGRDGRTGSAPPVDVVMTKGAPAPAPAPERCAPPAPSPAPAPAPTHSYYTLSFVFNK